MGLGLDLQGDDFFLVLARRHMKLALGELESTSMTAAKAMLPTTT